MDQTKSKDQTFLWHLRKRSEDTTMDCCMRLYALRDHQEGAGAGGLAQHFSTDPVRSLIRKK